MTTIPKNLCIEPEQFKIENLHVALTKDVIEKQIKKLDRIFYNAFVNYDYDVETIIDGEKTKTKISQPLVVKTDDIRITEGGIPHKTDKEGKPSQWYATDEKRCFMRLPLDPNPVAGQNGAQLTGGKKLRTLLKAIDDYCQKNKEKLLEGLGKEKISKYVYKPLARIPEEIEGVEQVAKKKDPLERLKLMFDSDWATKRIKTQVRVKLANGTLELQKGIETVTDLEKFVTWNSTIRCLIAFDKLKVSIKKIQGEFTYSIGAICLQVVVTVPNQGAVSYKDSFKMNVFDDIGKCVNDDEDDSTQVHEKDKKESKKESKKEVKKESKKQSDSEDESDSDNDSDKEQSKKKEELPKSKMIKDSDDENDSDDESESDNDSDDDDKKKSEDSDESDSEDDKKKKKIDTSSKASKSKSKPKKSKKSDSDDDDDDS